MYKYQTGNSYMYKNFMKYGNPNLNFIINKKALLFTKALANTRKKDS